MQDGKYPDALQALHRYRWRAVVRAAWADEQEAEQRLGQLYARTGYPDQAVGHFLAAGAVSELKQLAGTWPERRLRMPLPNGFADRPSWERAAAYTFVGSIADLLADEDAQRWTAAALAEFSAEQAAPAGIANPRLDAFTAFGKLADATTADQADAFIHFADRLIEREPHHHRGTDGAHADALIRIAATHATLRRDAVDQMCRALLSDEVMGNAVLAHAGRSLRAEKDIVDARCASAATKGHQHAALALVLAQGRVEPVQQLGRELVEALARPRVHVPGQLNFGGGWGDAAVLATVLDDRARNQLATAFARIAADRREVSLNRQGALEAFAIIAPHLADAARDEHFVLAIAAARAELDGSADDQLVPRGGALDRIRVDLGASTLSYSGLRAAAALAHTCEQYADVVAIAQRLMPDADVPAANAIAYALGLIPGETVGLDVSALASHGSEWIRALAAAMWCRTGGQPPELGLRLAADSHQDVRRTLAAHLPDGAAYQEVRVKLRADVRRSIRRVLA
jgi:hypothetical protein